jgi:hypothetical protein
MNVVFVVLWKDRVCDEELFVFESKDDAIEFVRNRIDSWDDIEEYFEKDIDGWDFFATYNCGNSIRVEQKEIKASTAVDLFSM